jgi:hypothetical protein
MNNCYLVRRLIKVNNGKKKGKWNNKRSN